MKTFNEFLNEDAMGAPPMGGAPGGDMGAPPPGGAPMGGMDPMGGMGGAPPMGGMDPMGGMGGGGVETPPIPQFADVWDVLDAILNNKPLEEPTPPPQQEQPPAPDMAGAMPPQDPMGAGMGMGGMEQQPPMQGQPNLMQ